MTEHRTSWLHRRAPRCFVGAALVIAASFPAPAGAAPSRECKGGKVLYAGQCLYPDEIKKRQQQRAEQSRAAADRKRADEAACAAARQADTTEAWRDYLEGQPEGACRTEADHRISRLEAEVPAAGSQPAPATEPTAAAPAPPPPSADDGTASSTEAPGISPWVWVGFGVGAAGFITFGVAGSIATAQASDLKDDCPADVCPPARNDDIESARLAAHVATAGLIIGGVGTAVGAVALALSLGGDDAADDTADRRSVQVRPYIGPASLGLTGRF